MASKKKKQQPKDRQLSMFEDHETLPPFSGTPMRAVEDPFVPQPASSQGYLPGLGLGWGEAVPTGEEEESLLLGIEEVSVRDEARQEGTSSPAEDAARKEEE